MIPIQLNKPTTPKPPPSREHLEVMMANGMELAVQTLLDTNPELKLKIESGKLVDSLTGAAVWLKKFITEDKETIAMKDDAMKLAKCNDEVLITGETGTGKEIIANAMIGDRTGKFIAVNCAGLPETLIESELFGHKSGAFTGANSSKQGMLSAAKDGVIFLDEIGEFPLSVQGKLLRALQIKMIRPVGENEERPISCRFVCATHRDLRTMVKEHTFRQDLYARISTFELHIKPIRDRKGDISAIVLSIGEQLKCVDKAKEFLEKYAEDIVNNGVDLSLNVRSLEQAIKRFSVLGRI